MLATEVQLAKNIATKAHQGQFRRDGKTPYILHCEAVAKRVGDDTNASAVAWLHDVIEDTSETAESLLNAGVAQPIVDAVNLLSKPDDVAYEAYLELVAASTLATKVKVADMLTNLSDAPTKSQIRKYAKGLLYLVPEA